MTDQWDVIAHVRCPHKGCGRVACEIWSDGTDWGGVREGSEPPEPHARMLGGAAAGGDHSWCSDPGHTWEWTDAKLALVERARVNLFDFYRESERQRSRSGFATARVWSGRINVQPMRTLGRIAHPR